MDEKKVEKKKVEKKKVEKKKDDEPLQRDDPEVDVEALIDAEISIATEKANIMPNKVMVYTEIKEVLSRLKSKL